MSDVINLKGYLEIFRETMPSVHDFNNFKVDIAREYLTLGKTNTITEKFARERARAYWHPES